MNTRDAILHFARNRNTPMKSELQQFIESLVPSYDYVGKTQTNQKEVRDFDPKYITDDVPVLDPTRVLLTRLRMM